MADTALSIIVLGIPFILGLIAREFLPGYAREKGKNLATKEDIAEITHEMERTRQIYTSEIEHLRAELRRSGYAWETRYAVLHAKRVEAIEGLYARLARLSEAFYKLVLAGKDPSSEIFQSLTKEASEAGTDLDAFFARHRLFLTPELVTAVQEIGSAARDAWVTFVHDLPHQAEGPMPHDERERRLQAWRKAKDIVTARVPSLLLQIEERMRPLLDAPAPEPLTARSSASRPVSDTSAPGVVRGAAGV